uniref:Uncharacterized protein n=1 Tax=Glossina austeni TaxID=7395 RepID=A0A1A9UD73_GLOAU
MLLKRFPAQLNRDRTRGIFRIAQPDCNSTQDCVYKPVINSIRIRRYFKTAILMVPEDHHLLINKKLLIEMVNVLAWLIQQTIFVFTKTCLLAACSDTAMETTTI